MLIMLNLTIHHIKKLQSSQHLTTYLILNWLIIQEKVLKPQLETFILLLDQVDFFIESLYEQ